MKKLTVALLVFEFVNLSISCPTRNLTLATAYDGTWSCGTACTSDSNCTGSDTCNCDGLCGLSCFNPEIECDANASFAHGKVTYDASRKYNTSAIYQCTDDGYYLQGQSVRKCRSDGNWSNIEPSCLRGCPEPKVSERVYSNEGLGGVYVPGRKITYRCKYGYRPRSAEIECQATYNWSAPALKCRKIGCGPPPELDNCDYTPKNNTNNGTTITYSCHAGQQHARSFKLTCLVGEGWEKDLNGEYKYPIVSSKVTLYGRKPDSLLPGFQIFKPISDEFGIRCYRVVKQLRVTGKSQQKTTCHPPPPINNGNVTGDGNSSWKYDDAVTYTCNNGYFIDGLLTEKEVRCTASGTWSAEPVCEVGASRPEVATALPATTTSAASKELAFHPLFIGLGVVFCLIVVTGTVAYARMCCGTCKCKQRRRRPLSPSGSIPRTETMELEPMVA